MVFVRLRVYRVLGGFWWRHRAGWYSRFIETWAYPVAIDLVAIVGLAGVLAVLGHAAYERSLASLAWCVLAIAAYLLALAFLTSFGASATCEARHDGSAAELLGRYRKLLERHDFTVRRETSAGIDAVRGARAAADSRWRGFPLELSAAVVSSDGAATLSVRCAAESGRHRFVRGLVTRTAQAAANLEGAELAALDRTLVMRPGALLQGGLGTTVLLAMLACAILSTVALVGASQMLATYVFDLTAARAAGDEIRRLQTQLTGRIDAALRAEAQRLAEGLKEDSKGEAPGERLRRLAPFRVPGEFVAGAARADGSVAIFHPAGAQWPQDVPGDSDRMGLARLGNRVVRVLPQPQARALEARLGLKPGQLVVATSLALEDLARLAPDRSEEDDLEITFFDSSRPYLHYSWHPGKDVQVDSGAGGVVPADVLASAERSLESDWTMIFKDVLFGGDVGDTAIRDEMRYGARYRVYYSVVRKQRGKDDWDAVSVARAYEPVFETRESILPLAVALALMALLPVLIVTVVLASFIANRITRPVLQVREALRSIREGDNAVRLRPGRKDEIGQLQSELDRTAEQLARRDTTPRGSE